MRDPRRSGPLGEPRFVRWALIAGVLLGLGLLLLAPIVTILATALRDGLHVYWAAIADDETLAAARLTLLAIGISIPLNMVFGVAAAWAITKYDFRGRGVLVTLIDLPFSVSPVVSGMVFVLLFGESGLFGKALAQVGIRIIFAWPGIVLATMFVTFPYVARELIPLMQSQGSDEELAALALGASGWQTFWRVTLRNIRWPLIHGTLLTNARAIGEFGAVSVVSGHIRGVTNTLSLHIESLYSEFRFSSAFAVSSLLLIVGFLTVIGRRIIERKRKEPEASSTV